MNYKFHGQYTELDKNLFKSSQEEDLRKICRYLETNLNFLEKVRFEVFDTKKGKQEADPNHSISRASARFNEMAVYRFWNPIDDSHFPHEITHLVAYTWSKPYLLETELDTWDNKKIKKIVKMISTSFMQEGLAVAVDDIVFERKLIEDGKKKFIDDWCREQIKKMPNISACINMDGFGNFENKIVVPFSASLSKFLLITFGLVKYKKMYIQLKETRRPEDNLEIIELVYQLKEADLLRKWKEALLH